MNRKFYSIMTAAIIAGTAGCTCSSPEKELQSIIDNTVEKYEPLFKEANLAYWNGAISGKAEDFEAYSQANMKLTEILSDAQTFSKLKQIKESEKVSDPVLKRELEILYNMYLSKQADTTLLHAIIQKEMEIEQKYSGFRALYKGKSIDDNQVENILKTSLDSKELESVWKAHKQIGKVVSQDIIEVVKLRNKLAVSLGFRDFYDMSLTLGGASPEEVYELLDEVDSLTCDSFAQVKKEMDRIFAKKYSIKESELRPWHYQNRYFQEAPELYPVDLDSYYTEADLCRITTDYYASIGIDINSMMKASDLYSKPGKNQHAFCTDIDRRGDVRVLCNLSNNERWMGTMLHEFGHAVYSKGHDENEELPYLLRDAAAMFTTEAAAMLFERQSKNPQWMKHYIGISDQEAERISDACIKSARLKQLVFSRWVQVVSRFEKGMYADPDQDLNKLWWDLAEKYQLLKRPDNWDNADWASKIHIAIYPCYYHNYQLGELFASQMHHYIVNNVTKSADLRHDTYIGNKEVGQWINDNVFRPGMLYHWNDMIQRATGEKLSAKYYQEEFR